MPVPPAASLLCVSAAQAAPRRPNRREGAHLGAVLAIRAIEAQGGRQREAQVAQEHTTAFRTWARPHFVTAGLPHRQLNSKVVLGATSRTPVARRSPRRHTNRVLGVARWGLCAQYKELRRLTGPARLHWLGPNRAGTECHRERSGPDARAEEGDPGWPHGRPFTTAHEPPN